MKIKGFAFIFYLTCYARNVGLNRKIKVLEIGALLTFYRVAFDWLMTKSSKPGSEQGVMYTR